MRKLFLLILLLVASLISYGQTVLKGVQECTIGTDYIINCVVYKTKTTIIGNYITIEDYMTNKFYNYKIVAIKDVDIGKKKAMDLSCVDEKGNKITYTLVREVNSMYIYIVFEKKNKLIIWTCF